MEIALHGQPRRARTLDDLNHNLATALVRMHTDVVLVDGGIVTHKIHERTVTALITRQLIEEARDKRARPVWKPTIYGLEVIRAEVPRFLAAKAQKGYVSDPRLGMRAEPEAIDEQTQRYQTADAHDRLQGLPGRRQEALRAEAHNLSRRLKQEARSADVTSLEVVAQLERIRTEIARLEQLRAA